MTVRPTMTVPKAAGVLGFTGGASMNAVHARYRELAKTWHPDISHHDRSLSHDTFIRIKEAHDILTDYCMNYEISFRPEDIRKGTGYDSKEFWMSRFGNDPIWG
jgi:DnaJ-class molecular chaperone